jgi:radical SAM enzyme (TIGR01210 family)
METVHKTPATRNGWDTALSSWLPPARKAEIGDFVSAILPQLQEHRHAHLQEMHRARVASGEGISKRLPAWSQISPASSPTGHRLIVGLRHNKCEYRIKDPLGLGCFNCGFYANSGNEGGATIEELLCQMEEALERGRKDGRPYDVLEFLGDGSFLNDHEVSDAAQKEILGRVARVPRVKRVLVESTPEHPFFTEEKLHQTLERLRPDQSLEVAIGLETADDFIRKTSVNKGFGLREFETAAEMAASVNAKKGGRCAIATYLLIKPAMLTVPEAVEDACRTIHWLGMAGKKHKVSIIPILEPAVVARGTLLSLLHERSPGDKWHYAALNYWTSLEILARIARDPSGRRLLPDLRVGGREDMHAAVKLPAFYGAKGEYVPHEKELYEAAQDFNRHHDVEKMFAAIELLYPGGREGLLQEEGSLQSWRRRELKGAPCHTLSFLHIPDYS